MKMRKIVSILLIVCLVFALTGCSSSDYKKAVTAMESGDYSAASEVFKALGDYKDSADLAVECDYNVAVALVENEEYEPAIEVLEALDGYKDSADYLNTARDAYIFEQLQGKWISDPIDYTDIFMEALYYTLAYEDMEGLIDYLDVSFPLTFQIQVKQDLAILAPEEESFGVTCGELKTKLASAMYDFLYDMLVELCDEYGYTFDGLLAELGLESYDDYLYTSFGMSLDEFIEEVMPIEEIVDASVFSYVLDVSIENQVVTFDEDEVTFDFDAGTLSFVDEDLGEDIIFHRA